MGQSTSDARRNNALARHSSTAALVESWPAGRVLLVISALEAGGAERIITLLANHLAAQGCNVVLATFETRDATPYYPIDPRIEIHRIESGMSRVKVLKVVGRVRALRRLIREFRPDVIVSFLVKINVLTMISAAGLDVPVIVSERNNPQRQPLAPAWSWLRKCLYPRSTFVVAPSRGVLACFPSSVQRIGRVIPNPVDLSAPQRRTTGACNLVAVGRLLDQKGFDLLLHAFSRIAQQRPEWNLIIYGEGPARGQLEELHCGLGPEGRVQMPGVTSAPGQWIESADVFVLSSRYEGFPNVIVEAMAAGLPIVSFDCPWGPTEILRDGINGLLVEHESIPALSDALLRVTGDPELRKRLGQAARDSARRFEKGQIMKMWDELLRETVAGGPAEPVARRCRKPAWLDVSEATRGDRR